MCLTVQEKIAKGPESRSDSAHHLKQHKTRKPFVIQRKSLGDFSVYFKWLHHEVGGVLRRIGEVWGDDSLSEEVEDVRVDCRWTVLWKSLLLIRTTGEKRRSWKWLKSEKHKYNSVISVDLFVQKMWQMIRSSYTYYSLVGVLASLALIMNSGKRIENKEQLGRKTYSNCNHLKENVVWKT